MITRRRRSRQTASSAADTITDYRYEASRKNNPPAGFGLPRPPCRAPIGSPGFGGGLNRIIERP